MNGLGDRRLPVDHHLHIPLCGHADGMPAEYVAAAGALAGVGFSDHLPYLEPAMADPALAMSWDDLPVYLGGVRRLREESDTPVLLGIEADYFPGQESRLANILGELPLDYVYGAVHWVGDWPFDDSRHRRRYEGADINKLFRDYYGLVAGMAASGLFDVWAHPDLPKKFGYRPAEPVYDDEDVALEAVAAAGMVIEVNTSGLRKPAREIYPSLGLLRRACAAGIPVTFGSDAHRPGEVGHEFKRAVTLAREAGYRTYTTFSRREKVGLTLP
ncbi:MAG: histidinol-phosphatase HisJ family protein [candidate division Zixibacteria bacterium]|nr:histidinol-phosphatase HisJ family protein [candidate division Zixibacteria bacterium]